jgi:hypothetical protein
MRFSPIFLGFFAALAAACGPSPDANAPNRSPLAEKWLTRAKQSYRSGDFEDARQSGDSALKAAPRDQDIRVVNARIALAALDYAQTLKLTEGLQSTDVLGLRGRAHWYSGDIEQAADDLEAMLQDPSVKDPWAREVAKLARRGQGRHPFAIEGGLVASVEMPPAGAALVVPCELEGERILALVATSIGELVVDSNSRKEPAWVNLKFGDRIEVKDVPALTQDLSGLSRQLGAPVKALLGVNLLRHMHVTFDRRGGQFIVRRDEPTPPPDASRVPLWYVRGGGMLLRASMTPKGDALALLLVDSSAPFPLALEDATWRRAGIDPATLKPEPAAQNMKAGMVPSMKLGGFDLQSIPALQGAPLGDIQGNVDVDLGGVMGAGLLALFRVTFGDEGRFVWLEPDPAMAMGRPPAPAPAAGPPPSSITPPSPALGPVPVPVPAPGPAPTPGPATSKPSTAVPAPTTPGAKK